MRWALLLLAGCGRIAFDPLATRLGDAAGGATDASDAAPGACTFGGITRQVDLATANDDWGPALSPSGTMIVFGRSPVGSNLEDLYVALRQGNGWSAPALITNLATAAKEADPEWNAAGDRLYYVSESPGISTLFVSAHAGASFNAPQMVMGLPAINIFGITLSADELEVFYTFSNGTNMEDIGRATRPSTASAFTDLGAVTELNTSASDGWPELSADGLTIYIETTRGSANADIYTATRPAVGAPFGAVTPVTTLNDPTEDGDPDLSADGKTMMFSSSRAGGSGGADIYLATCN